MQESQDLITIEVYAHENMDTRLAEWEPDAITLTDIKCQLPFTLSELQILKDSLDEISPKAKSEWHEIKLCRVCENRGWDEPSLLYYKLVDMLVIRYQECQQCGHPLSIEDQRLIEQYGVEPYCSQYCSEVGNGIPMPVSSGALVFDKWHNHK